jgi:hypothetical protein
MDKNQRPPVTVSSAVRFLVRQEAWLILSVERYWPWELLVHHEADPAAAQVTSSSEPGDAKAPAVTRQREPVSASIRKGEWPSFQKG